MTMSTNKTLSKLKMMWFLFLCQHTEQNRESVPEYMYQYTLEISDINGKRQEAKRLPYHNI